MEPVILTITECSTGTRSTASVVVENGRLVILGGDMTLEAAIALESADPNFSVFGFGEVVENHHILKEQPNRA